MAQISEFFSAANVLDATSAAPRTARPFVARLSSVAKWIGDCVETMADSYAAATIYEQLSRLSDAELHRRGLSRSDLGRDVMVAHERAGRAD